MPGTELEHEEETVASAFATVPAGREGALLLQLNGTPKEGSFSFSNLGFGIGGPLCCNRRFLSLNQIVDLLAGLLRGFM